MSCSRHRARQRSAVSERAVGLAGRDQRPRDHVRRPGLVGGTRAGRARPVVRRRVGPAEQLLVVVGGARGEAEQVPDRVVGLDALAAVPVAGRGLADTGTSRSGSGSGRAGLEQGLHPVEDPDPAVLDVRPRERAEGEVAVDQPDAGEVLADLLDGPLDAAGRLGGQRGVVQHVPGLHEPSRRARGRRGHLLDDAVDGVAAVGRDGAIGPAGARRLDEAGARGSTAASTPSR